MPVIALIPVPDYEFAISEVLKKYTKITPLRIFGKDVVIDPESKHLNILASGIVCVLDCTEKELFEQHTDAWATRNPMTGQWYQREQAELSSDKKTTSATQLGRMTKIYQENSHSPSE